MSSDWTLAEYSYSDTTVDEETKARARLTCAELALRRDDPAAALAEVLGALALVVPDDEG